MTPDEPPEEIAETKVRPNYILIALGIVVAFSSLLAQLLTSAGLPPYFQALIIAAALTLILYGLYPVPAIRGKFGNLAVVGPAALGLFIFLFVWKGISGGPDRQFVVLQNVPDSTLNSFDIEAGPTITLVEVDSLSADKLEVILNDIRTALIKGFPEWSQDRVQTEIRDALGRILEALKFGSGPKAEALRLFDSWGDGASGIDGEWKTLVSRAAQNHENKKNFIKRVKRQPFALLKVTPESNDTQLRVLLPGAELNLGRMYTVPIIANPSLTTVRGINEGIVLQKKP